MIIPLLIIDQADVYLVVTVLVSPTNRRTMVSIGSTDSPTGDDMELIRTERLESGQVAAKIYSNPEWDEYVVKPFDHKCVPMPESCWDYVDTKVEAFEQATYHRNQLIKANRT